MVAIALGLGKKCVGSSNYANTLQGAKASGFQDKTIIYLEFSCSNLNLRFRNLTKICIANGALGVE
jgi:hypothetical protein